MADPDIRFSLANERTFLAWIRTAIALVGSGVLVFHLLEQSAETTTLALVLIAAGAVAGIAGYLHFHQADRAIRAGVGMPTRRLIPIVLTVAVILAVAAAAATVLA